MVCKQGNGQDRICQAENKRRKWIVLSKKKAGTRALAFFVGIMVFLEAERYAGSEFVRISVVCAEELTSILTDLEDEKAPLNSISFGM